MRKFLYVFVILFFAGCGSGDTDVSNVGGNGDVEVTINGNTARITNGQCYYNDVPCGQSSSCISKSYGFDCTGFIIDLDDGTINYHN